MSTTETHYRKGDVVLVLFAGLAPDGRPYNKRKPAVIVSSHSVFSGFDDVLLVPLKSWRKTDVLDRDTVVQVKMDSDAGARNFGRSYRALSAPSGLAMVDRSFC